MKEFKLDTIEEAIEEIKKGNFTSVLRHSNSEHFHDLSDFYFHLSEQVGIF